MRHALVPDLDLASRNFSKALVPKDGAYLLLKLLFVVLVRPRGLAGLFDAVYGVEHADYHPKPQPQAFARVFGIDGLGIHDNFYELGGHSLLATQILVRLQDSFGVELPARTIFESHTIADLARQIEMLLWMEQSRRDQTEGPGEDREELEF